MVRMTHASAFRVRFVAVLMSMYLLVVLLVTLWPTTVDRGLDPYVDRVLEELHDRGLPAFVDYGFIEFSANVVFFVPVGLLGGLLCSRRLWWAPIAWGAALSTAIELVQGALLPGRVASAADVIANTAGATAGCITAVAIRLLVLHRDALVIRDVLEGRRGSDGLPVRD